jgi:hypothetical protein
MAAIRQNPSIGAVPPALSESSISAKCLSTDMDHEDMEKNLPFSIEQENPSAELVSAPQCSFKACFLRLALYQVELRGICPVALEDRTDTNVLSLFFLWFTNSCNLLPYAMLLLIIHFG